jgi:putative metallopeptidase DUF4344
VRERVTVRRATPLVLVALALAACGSGDDGDSARDEKQPPKRHGITVTYETPSNDTERVAKEILQVGGTEGVAKGFTKSFKLPRDLTVRVQRGSASPFYDPSDKSITWSYGFVDQIARVLQQGGVVENQDDLGRQLASITSFITVHEMGHAFVDVFEIPITGREEDAVDGMATVFMTDAVDNGTEYAFYAARFFGLLQDVQGAPDVRQFQDEHSLSIQRFYDILCIVAGSSEESFERVASFGVLGQDRLRRCPAEYQQKSRSWRTLLKPHVRP